MRWDQPVVIVGGGLAGCEATWQLMRRGHSVLLYEMKPRRFSPAHRSPLLAELVCSNSLRAASPEHAVGLLKEEMRRLDSLILAAADATAVPAGRALAVDREAFSRYIEARLATWGDRLCLCREEVTAIPETGLVILAPGPLASEALSRAIAALTGQEYLYFYDAIAPIVEADSIDLTKVFFASRYGDGGDDYLNCPMNEEQYRGFREALLEAEKVPLRPFEEARFFEGCLPVEVLAARGEMTLAYGPMKPVGLVDPKTGKSP
ncbi:MAG: methylenetetrahydrofolate--tRNA-(uracil(54)-C(5))-methyltransferase (FADH(2)-oxidizing) TrmFO, partial [Syntrophales bacterium]|nr:methylenetetrahydrofolate--tRNA-(uracil(54)-C(5))-methyltransferase (FADH(2)-oxidizing) TrmFO [Syntrophales bacterium]